MHWTQSRANGRTDGLTYRLYASLSSFAGIKTKCTCIPMKQNKSKKVMFIFSLHVHILSVYVIVVKFIHVVKFIGGGGMSTLQKFKGGIMSTYTKMRRGFE